MAVDGRAYATARRKANRDIVLLTGKLGAQRVIFRVQQLID